MDLLGRMMQKLKDDLSIQSLVRIVLFLAAVFLLKNTWTFLRDIVGLIWNAVRPFFWGFVIAYILHRPINYLENHKISRKIAIPLIYLVLFGIFVWLVYSMVPMLVSRFSDFINTMINSVKWLRDTLVESYNGPGGTWISNMINTSLEALTDVRALFPSVSGIIPDFVSRMFSALVVGLISTIISIFMSFEWDRIRYHAIVFSLRISRRFHRCLFAVNDEISDYLGSMIILMCIRFAEYSMVYLLIGHQDWLILGIATAVSLIIPYVGPTSVNTVGILSALQLPTFNVVLLIALICILAQIDEYVITPMVHSHNLKLSPMWILFSIFASSTLFGVSGFIIAIPVYLIIRTVIRMYLEMDAEEVLEPRKEETA